MTIAYLDAFSGLSGDMIVGAMLDLGVDFTDLERAIDGLGLEGYRLSTHRKAVGGISALKFDVDVTKPQPERHLGEISTMIERAAIAETVKRGAKSIFAALAQAEAKIHQSTPDRVHFHEVGAVDSIIDIVATAFCVESLGIATLLVSPLPMGGGFVRSRHGVIPVPAPATVELLSGFAVRLGDGEAEMVTPTGAAVVKTLGRSAALPVGFLIEKVGYGAGSRHLSDRPNLLRVMLGSTAEGIDSDEMVEIAVNIDDLNPQIYDHVVSRLLGEGARDVTITPTIMKKGRPAAILTVLAAPADRERMASLIFAETTTIGLRYHRVSRLKLPREIHEVQTRWGAVRVKVSGRDPARPRTVSPEYDDCRRIAAEHDVPLRDVIDESREAARRLIAS